MMSLSDLFARLNPRKRRAEKAREELKANAEKALRMKQEADSGTRIPPHRTSHDGGVKGEQLGMTDADAGSQGAFTPKLKRTGVARSGDAS
jgi:hypothetical protein